MSSRVVSMVMLGNIKKLEKEVSELCRRVGELEEKLQVVLDTTGDRPRKGCEECNWTGSLLHFYERGPNDPPGNTAVPCPMCSGGK
jgi:hypothetical protein